MGRGRRAHAAALRQVLGWVGRGRRVLLLLGRCWGVWEGQEGAAVLMARVGREDESSGGSTHSTRSTPLPCSPRTGPPTNLNVCGKLPKHHCAYPCKIHHIYLHWDMCMERRGQTVGPKRIPAHSSDEYETSQTSEQGKPADARVLSLSQVPGSLRAILVNGASLDICTRGTRRADRTGRTRENPPGTRRGVCPFAPQLPP